MDLTTLKIEVDATDVITATQALERLTKAAVEAKAALDQLRGVPNEP